VGLLDRDGPAAQQAADQLVREGAQAVAAQVDVAEREQVDAAYEQVRCDLGPIAILVTSARVDQFTRFMPTRVGTLAHHPQLAIRWLAYTDVLLRTPALPVRLRELALLRVAYRTRSVYERTQHVRLKDRYGITADEVAALAAGASAPIWAPRERHVLAAADQLLDRYGVDDETWAGLAAGLDERQLLELLFLVGTRACLGMVFNSCGIEMDQDVPVIPFPAEH
jgi:alkylhydroperoxidase family enzyme